MVQTLRLDTLYSYLHTVERLVCVCVSMRVCEREGEMCVCFVLCVCVDICVHAHMISE